MKDPGCIFCNIPDEEIILKNECAFVINDKFPHSKGHVLIIPFSHEEDFFNLAQAEQKGIIQLLNDTKKYTDHLFNPAAYNVSINNGKEAGQIIMHSHVHLIPRYKKN
ncbi:MAG: HIT family protein [bacterium]